MRRASVLLTAACAAGTMACATTPATKDVVAFTVVMPAALDTISPNQTFAFVDPTAHFTGAVAADDSARASTGGLALADAVARPLDAIGWRQVAAGDARFHISVLIAVRGECRYRGFVIERTEDRARFWRLYSAARLSERTMQEQAADDVVGLILGEAIPFPVSPPRPAYCPNEFAERLRYRGGGAGQRRGDPATASPTDRVRRPPPPPRPPPQSPPPKPKVPTQP